MFDIAQLTTTGCFVAFLGNVSILKSGCNIKKNILLSSPRDFLLSTHTFSLSTSIENSEGTRKKATKCTKHRFQILENC